MKRIRTRRNIKTDQGLMKEADVEGAIRQRAKVRGEVAVDEAAKEASVARIVEGTTAKEEEEGQVEMNLVTRAIILEEGLSQAVEGLED